MHSLTTLYLRAWLGAALVLGACLAWPTLARAETTACQVITTVPVNLTMPGKYCLEQDFAQSIDGSAIRLMSDDILLDCNHHRIRTTYATNTGTGIDSGAERKRLVVRNCVVDGFHDGISLSTNTAVGNRQSRIENNTVLRFRQHGIVAWGSNMLIAGNAISQARGDDNGGMVGIALWSSDGNGTGNVIRDNTVFDFRPGANPSTNATNGIFLANVRNTQISGNTISALNARTGQCTWGIYASGATGTQVAGNTILSVPQPVAAPLDGGQCVAVGMYGTAQQQATNVCVDNVVGHFSTAYYGCVLGSNSAF